MNLGDLTSLIEKPIAAVSSFLNTPNAAGRYRPFYLQNLVDAGLEGTGCPPAVYATAEGPDHGRHMNQPIAGFIIIGSYRKPTP